MIVRYLKTADSQSEKLAKIYTVDEHGIKSSAVDFDAKKIISRLVHHGHQAYIVGGAVRDLLIGRVPKDFDIATDAHPGKIRKIFWNSRIIGRRFRLVHVYAGNKILEVATFRSSDLSKSNSFGTMKEDALRRDFTFNGLYYCPEKEYIYDYVDGFSDIRDKKIKPILPLESIFVDDPVRIIRVIRYAMITGFKISGSLRKQLTCTASELTTISSSRLTEEVMKILKSGKSAQIFEYLLRRNVLGEILPNIREKLEEGKGAIARMKSRALFLEGLHKLDGRYRQRGEVSTGEMIVAMVAALHSVELQDEGREAIEHLYKDSFRGVKYLMQPITPPNKDVEQAVRILFKMKGLPLPKKRRYRKPPVRKK